MKHVLITCILVLLSACSSPSFVGDAPPVPVTSTTPERFELPARFAVARIVYGSPQAAGATEAALWTDLAHRAARLGTFAPLVTGDGGYARGDRGSLVETARAQRYRYLIELRMDPATGSADIVLVHVGSGGVMATAQAVSPSGGQRGFWGGQIGSPARLERVTLNIAQAAVPVVEDMLRGAAERQR